MPALKKVILKVVLRTTFKITFQVVNYTEVEFAQHIDPGLAEIGCLSLLTFGTIAPLMNCDRAVDDTLEKSVNNSPRLANSKILYCELRIHQLEY